MGLEPMYGCHLCHTLAHQPIWPQKPLNLLLRDFICEIACEIVLWHFSIQMARKHLLQWFQWFQWLKFQLHDNLEHWFQVLDKEENYPLNIKFGRPKLSSNQKIMLASMFHSLYAISVQISPEKGSSGIQRLETDVFTLNCEQTLTGVKFIVIAENKQVYNLLG